MEMKKKKTLGRQKIEMKKIQDEKRLRVTLAKRRGGLFKKASELSLLCGAQVAIVVQYPSEKIYTFEAPSVEALVNRIHSHDSPVQMMSGGGGGRWWEDPIDEGLNLRELEEYLAALESLREDVENKTTIINSTANAAADALPLSIQDYGYGLN